MPSDKPVTTLSVDFSGVEDRQSGGSAAHVPEGDYLLKLESASVKKNSKNDGKHVLWIFKIVEGAGRGTVYHRTTLKEEQLWSLRNLLSDLLQKDIPKKALNIDFAKYKGKTVGATLEDDDPYEGKIKSKIAYTFPASEWEEKQESTDDSDDEEDEDQSIDATDDDDDDEEELETVDVEDI
jgi:hypothetical protein